MSPIPATFRPLPALSSPLVYSTFLGGTDYDLGFGLAVDAMGNAYLTGETISPDFPIARALDASLDAGFGAL